MLGILFIDSSGSKPQLILKSILNLPLLTNKSSENDASIEHEIICRYRVEDTQVSSKRLQVKVEESGWFADKSNSM